MQRAKSLSYFRSSRIMELITKEKEIFDLKKQFVSFAGLSLSLLAVVGCSQNPEKVAISCKETSTFETIKKSGKKFLGVGDITVDDYKTVTEELEASEPKIYIIDYKEKTVNQLNRDELTEAVNVSISPDFIVFRPDQAGYGRGAGALKINRETLQMTDNGFLTFAPPLDTPVTIKGTCKKIDLPDFSTKGKQI